MNSKDYQKLAVRTESNDMKRVADRLSDPRVVRLLHAEIGLSTESGEFSDQLKRHIFYGRDLDTTNLEEEAGDLLWYLAIALDEIGSSFEHVMAMNIAKLRARYPKQFSEVEAENRNLISESVAMAQASTAPQSQGVTVVVDNGKYTFKCDPSTSWKLKILRHGDDWVTIHAGSTSVMSLMYRCEELEAQLAERNERDMDRE